MRRVLVVCCFLVASVFSVNAAAELPVPTYDHKAKTAKTAKKTTASKPKPKDAKAKAKAAPPKAPAKKPTPVALVKSGMPEKKK